MVVIGPTGVPFIVEHREVVGLGVPVIFSDLTYGTYKSLNLPPDVTGVIGDPYPEKTIELAKSLQPGARRLVVISGDDAVDRRWRETARKAIEAHHPELETEYWSGLSYDAMLADVSRLPSDTMVLLLTFFADSEGKRFIPRNVATAVAKASSAPVYGLYDTFIGQGIVGGYIDTYESIGTAVADMVAGNSFGRRRDHACPARQSRLDLSRRCAEPWTAGG